jgi:DNA (cytosine-5)-methyltransferase 1
MGSRKNESTKKLLHCSSMQGPSTLELCAGAGGQALGYEQAGFNHVGLVEIDHHACDTLRLNRPHWNVMETDLNNFSALEYKGVDIVTGGLPCPPFSVAGKQLGELDERNLFSTAIRIVDEVRPRAVMFENVRGILDGIFEDYRKFIAGRLRKLGYETGWHLMNACHFKVPQLRPRVIFVAVKKDLWEDFQWPSQSLDLPPTVGETLFDLMSVRGWRGAKRWKEFANDIGPTIVGGSKKHGGPDLGPTRAKKAWAALGVDGHGIVSEAPERDFVGMPRLTVRMVARIQGFPDAWQFSGAKTNAYRQVGNALPPPFACAMAKQLEKCLSKRKMMLVRA